MKLKSTVLLGLQIQGKFGKKSSDLDHTDWEDGGEGIRFQNRKTLKSRYVKRPIQIEKWTIDFDFISVFFFFFVFV